MALPGETITGKNGTYDSTCSVCGKFLPLKICRSNAGYYVGTWCDLCGPYSRESGHYHTKEEAAASLKTGNFRR